MHQLLSSRIYDVPIVVLDTETTGLFPGLGHRIVEIGAIRLEPQNSAGWGEVNQFSRLIRPGRPMDPQASRVNHIFDADLVDAPFFSEVADEFLALLEGALVVAHNARFDAEFVGTELYIHSLTAENESDYVLPNPWLCTLQLARRHFHFGRNNLGHIARMLKVRTGQAHRALNDVYMTSEVFKRMIRDLFNHHFETVEDFLHAQGGAIYTPPPPHVYLPPSLKKALHRKNLLRIVYMGTRGETERIINPLYLTEHEGVSNLIAYCHLRQDQRTFRLDRIISAEIVDNSG